MIRICSRVWRPWPDPIGEPELACEHRVGVDVRQDLEPLVDENARRLQRLLGVGEEVAGVGDHFELDPVGKAHGAGQAGDADGLLRGPAARGVGQDAVTGPVDRVQDRLLFRVVEVEAAQRDGHQLAAGGFEGGEHRFIARVLAGAEK